MSYIVTYVHYGNRDGFDDSKIRRPIFTTKESAETCKRITQLCQVFLGMEECA